MSRARFAVRSAPARACGSTAALTGALSRAAALLAFIAHEDLVAKVVPDLFVDLGEATLEPDLGDVSGSRQVDFVVSLHRAGRGREDEHAGAHPDRRPG